MATVDGFIISLQENRDYSYSLITRKYVDGCSYRLRIVYKTELDDIKGFKVMQLSLKGLASGRMITLDKMYMRDLEAISRNRYGSKRYNYVNIDLEELQYEDYEVTGMFQALSNNGIIKEYDFSVILNTDFSKRYGISRFWDVVFHL